MSEQQKYLSKARAALARTLPPAATSPAFPAPAASGPPVHPAAAEQAVPGDVYERNERYEISPEVANPTDGPSPLVLARLRAAISKRLRHWEDERLIALAVWHLALAFERGGASDFRRHLPRSLAGLTNDDLADLVDWPSLATLEQVLWTSDPEDAERLSRGAQRLATWWNKRRDEQRRATRQAAAKRARS
jgi:hypothetical protein